MADTRIRIQYVLGTANAGGVETFVLDGARLRIRAHLRRAFRLLTEKT